MERNVFKLTVTNAKTKQPVDIMVHHIVAISPVVDEKKETVVGSAILTSPGVEFHVTQIPEAIYRMDQYAMFREIGGRK